MSDIFEDVHAFHVKFKQVIGDRPQHLTKRKLAERANFMLEELIEFSSAAGLKTCPETVSFIVNSRDDDQDLPPQADALIDLVYVALGTAVMLGLPWQKLWDDVQRANMAKALIPVAHRPYQAAAAQIGKPEGWVGPHTDQILFDAGYDRSEFTGYSDVVCKDDIYALDLSIDDSMCVDDVI